MEPLSVMLATGAIAICAHKMRKNSTGDGFTLPTILANEAVGGSCLMEVVAVHLRSAELAPRFAGRGLLARVKYGGPGESVWCDAAEVAVAEPSKQAGEEPTSSVELGQTCIFLRQRHYVPQIRIRLHTPHLGRVVAKAECSLIVAERLTRDMDLTLYGAGLLPNEEIGKIRIAFETRLVSKSGLQEILGVVGAQRRREGFVAGLTPVCEGIPADASAAGEDDAQATATEVLMGVPVAGSGSQWPLQ